MGHPTARAIAVAVANCQVTAINVKTPTATTVASRASSINRAPAGFPASRNALSVQSLQHCRSRNGSQVIA